MHNAALVDMALIDARFTAWRYDAVDVPPEELPAALSRLRLDGYLGLNLTVPHKVEAMPHIAKVDPSAKRLGAVNTLRASPGGWEGFNTDGYGLSHAIREELGLRYGAEPVILLGAGGAARAAAVQALDSGTSELWLGNRSRQRLQGLVETLAALDLADRVHPFSLDHPPPDLPSEGILVNATACGLKPGDPSPIDLETLSPRLAVYDMIYNPAETQLLHLARQRGMRTANGLGMLVWQGARALEIWTGAPVPVRAMRRAADAQLAAAT